MASFGIGVAGAICGVVFHGTIAAIIFSCAMLIVNGRVSEIFVRNISRHIAGVGAWDHYESFVIFTFVVVVSAHALYGVSGITFEGNIVYFFPELGSRENQIVFVVCSSIIMMVLARILYGFSYNYHIKFHYHYRFHIKESICKDQIDEFMSDKFPRLQNDRMEIMKISKYSSIYYNIFLSIIFSIGIALIIFPESIISDRTYVYIKFKDIIIDRDVYACIFFSSISFVPFLLANRSFDLVLLRRGI